jgi:hypothetical protein
MSILVLLDKKWVKNFLQKRLYKYFPEAKSLIGFDIKILKVFLDYHRVVIRYDLLLAGKKKFRKAIIVKAEKGKGFLKESSRTETDYLTNIFLRKQKLGHLVVLALEYYYPLQAFFYEPVDGGCLKQLSIEHRGEEFVNLIPQVVQALKQIHNLKAKPRFIVRGDIEERKQHSRYLDLIKKYYPFGFKRFKKIIKACENLKLKYNDYFIPKNYCITHGDLHSGNIFMVDHQIKFLDFSDSTFYDPLDDLGCFFINTELMFEYDFHKNYREMIQKVEDLFCQIYFRRPLTRSEKIRIYYYILNNLSRIISYVALSEFNYKTQVGPDELLEKLIKISEEKIAQDKNFQ